MTIPTLSYVDADGKTRPLRCLAQVKPKEPDMEIIPMSEDEIVEAWNRHNEFVVTSGSKEEWLRSALRSYLAWAAEEAKPDKSKLGEYDFELVGESVYDMAVESYRANLLKLANGV